jgi:hypothetical protein
MVMSPPVDNNNDKKYNNHNNLTPFAVPKLPRVLSTIEHKNLFFKLQAGPMSSQVCGPSPDVTTNIGLELTCKAPQCPLAPQS